MAHSPGDVQVSLPPPSPLPTFSTDPVPDDDPDAFVPPTASLNALSHDLDARPGSPGVKTSVTDASLPGKPQSPSKENLPTGKDLLRRVTLRSPSRKSKVDVSRCTRSTEELNDAAGAAGSDGTTLKEKSHNVAAGSSSKDAQDALPEPVARPPRTRSVSGKIATFARKISSRSPSPAPKGSRRSAAPSLEQSPAKRAQVSAAESSPPKGDPDDANAASPSRRKSILHKRPRRPLSTFVSRSKSDDPASGSSGSLRSKTSFEKLTSLHISTPVLPPVPRPTATSVPATVEVPRKKDELWSVFRGLESDYQKYVSSIAIKSGWIC